MITAQKIYMLEDLVYLLFDDWKKGSYTNGEYMYTGLEMAEIFIAEARKRFPGEPYSEVIPYSEQLQEAVDEQALKYRD